MSKKICPQCGCIFDNGRFECIDCGKRLVSATDEDVAAYNKKYRKTLSRVSAMSAKAIPSKWQIFGAGILIVYALLLIIFVKSDLNGEREQAFSLLVVNIITAAGLLIPKPKLLINTKKDTNGKKRISFQFIYYKKVVMVWFCFAILLNVLISSIIFTGPVYIHIPAIG